MVLNEVCESLNAERDRYDYCLFHLVSFGPVTALRMILLGDVNGTQNSFRFAVIASH